MWYEPKTETVFTVYWAGMSQLEQTASLLMVNESQVCSMEKKEVPVGVADSSIIYVAGIGSWDQQQRWSAAAKQEMEYRCGLSDNQSAIF